MPPGEPSADDLLTGPGSGKSLLSPASLQYYKSLLNRCAVDRETMLLFRRFCGENPTANNTPTTEFILSALKEWAELPSGIGTVEAIEGELKRNELRWRIREALPLEPRHYLYPAGENDAYLQSLQSNPRHDLKNLAYHVQRIYMACRWLDDPSMPDPPNGDAMSPAQTMAAVSKLSAWLRKRAGELETGSKAAPIAATAMTWQVAKAKAEEYCNRHPFPGVNALAAILKCSTSTMSKAVKRSTTLKARQAEQEAKSKSISTVAMTEETMASATQSREPDPADESFRRLLEQAKPDERVKLNVMTPDQRRELVGLVENDPDAIPNVRGPFRR